MELNSNEARIPQALEIKFAHSAQCGLLSFGVFARCCAVSRGWRDTVYAALLMFVHSVSGNIFWDILTIFFFGKPRAAAAGGLRRRRKFWGMLLSSDHFY